MTAWLSEPSESGEPARWRATAGPMPSARSRSVVGHMQVPVPESPSRAMSSSVRWVLCTPVVRGPRTPWSASSRVGVRPCAARQASFSAVCSDRCTCSGARRSSAHRATVVNCPAGTARTEWIAAPIRAWSRSLRTAQRSAQASALPSENRSWWAVGGSPKPEER